MLGLPLALVAALALALVVTRGTGEPPPATGAAAVVPANALLYVHLSTDPTRPAVKRTQALTPRLPDFPLLTGALTARLDSMLAGPSAAANVDFGTDVRPWLGKEAAFAVLDSTSSSAGSLIVLDVRNRARARNFLTSHGAVPDGSYRNVQLLGQPSGTVLAFVRHYLVLGQDASVRAAVDASAGAAPALAGSSAYQRAAAGEPADRILDAYVSAAGINRLLAPRRGLLGSLAALLSQPALTGTTLSVSAQSGGVRLRVHSALDPSVERARGGPASSFAPTLAGVMPSGSTLLLDTSSLRRIAPRVLAAGALSGLGGGIAPLLGRLGAAMASEGVNVQQVTSLFSGETAVALVPSGARHGAALAIVTHTRNQSATRAQLAQLGAPLAQLFPAPSSGPGVAPEFNDIQVAGVMAHQLALAPGLQLDYAVYKGLVVVSTSLRAMAGVVRHAHALSDEEAYRATLANRPHRVTSLLFLDFSQLLSLVEQTGLTRGATVAALQRDLEKIRAIGLASTGGGSDTTAELSLQIQ